MDRETALDQIRALLARGVPWAASDVFREAIVDREDDAELSYWGALAYARSGATRLARAVLDRVTASTAVSPATRREALSLSGRLWKDRIDRRAVDGPVDREAATLARDDYRAAYAVDADPFPGANAASLSYLIGDLAEAQRYAADVATHLDARRTPLTSWEEASRGEVSLLLGDVDGARAAYGRAVALAPDDAGSIASMRRQLGLLSRALPAADEIAASLRAPTVIAFSGHILDHDRNATPRFPAALESAVSARLAARLADLRRPVVYSSAACGSDILFLEAALAVGAEINIVLPFDRDDFVATSVAVGGPGWVERFDRALESADRVIAATDENYLGDDVLFVHAQTLINGLAILRAAQLATVPRLLCVLDRGAPGAVGGTRDALERWERIGSPIDTIDLGALRESMAVVPTVATCPHGPTGFVAPADRPRRSLKATMFADMAGFSRLHDAQAPLFHDRFLGIVAARIAATPTAPLEANTWGDAIYVVIEEAEAAASFALCLVDDIQAMDWTTTGLTESSDIRVALHTGPVFCGFDPIMKRDNYFGSSVTKTARIEPITPPGVVYASEAFAATLAAEAHASYVFEYVGDLPLAKSFGTSRIYRVDRR